MNLISELLIQLHQLSQLLYPGENGQRYIDLRILTPLLMLRLKLQVYGVFHTDHVNHIKSQLSRQQLVHPP